MTRGPSVPKRPPSRQALGNGPSDHGALAFCAVAFGNAVPIGAQGAQAANHNGGDLLVVVAFGVAE